MSFGEWFLASRTLKFAVFLTSVIFVIFVISFFSPYWLESVPDERQPDKPRKFLNLGKMFKMKYDEKILVFRKHGWYQLDHFF